MRLRRLALFAAVSPYALADVAFISPAAGATLAAGQVTIEWEACGSAPALTDLKTYTLQLFVGGNNPGDAANALPLIALTSTGDFAAGNSFTATIDPGVAASTENGFYLAMTSVATEGGTVINYSNRFTLTGMTGTTLASAEQAVTALNGATAGPPTQNNINNNANGAAGVETGAFAIPYNLQTGLTKYAPMQPVPATKITVKKYTPLFPTSAFSIATTWMPRASIATTLTRPQTFSVSSRENPAAPASQPTGDMAKYLARWKD